MFDRVTIVLEGVPVGKGRPRFGAGRTYTPAKTRAYEQALGYAARAAMGMQRPFEGPLKVSVIAGMPIPASWGSARRADAALGRIRPTGKPDGDNLLKAALDPLNKIVFDDDAQVVEATITKFYSAAPSLRIEVGMA